MANVKIDNGKNVIWMPIKEYELLMERRKSMSVEELNRFSYYMWNNFSYDGYDEWIKSKDNEVQDKKK